MKASPTKSLDKVLVGQTVLLATIQSAGRFRLRLAELGLNPEIAITVVKSEPGQPIIIRVRESLLAIDRETAHQLRVHIPGKGARRIHHRRHRRRRFGWRRRRR